MSDVTCPHCKQVFEMDASGYADILKQIRDSEYEKDLDARLKDASEKHQIEIELAKKVVSEQNAGEMADRDRRITQLQGEINAHATDIELAKKEVMEQNAGEMADRDRRITQLQGEINAHATDI